MGCHRGIAEKHEAMSVSTTHRRPRQDSSTSTCRASCCARFGRNPKLHGRKSASKTGSSTIFTAACTIRSRTGGTVTSYCPSCKRVSECCGWMLICAGQAVFGDLLKVACQVALTISASGLSSVSVVSVAWCAGQWG